MFKIFKPQSGLAPITIVLVIIGAFLLGSVISIFLYPYLHPYSPEPCDYDTFKGQCKIISIPTVFFPEQPPRKRIRFRFTPTEPLNLENVEWAKEEDIINIDYKSYPDRLGLGCFKNRYPPFTKEELEKCGIKENAVFDCKVKIITKGTCTPVIFNFIDTSDTEEIEYFLSEFPGYFESFEKGVEWYNECVNNNGIPRWSPTGPFCNLKTSDGGKICTDSGQCEGHCLAEDENSKSGKCSDMKSGVGCVFEMFNGEVSEICYD